MKMLWELVHSPLPCEQLQKAALLHGNVLSQDLRCFHANNNNTNMLIIGSNSKLTMFIIFMECIKMPTFTST